jgi:hypothetical protein
VIAMFLEEDGDDKSYSFKFDIDLSKAPFWLEIKNATERQQKVQH